MKRYSIERIEIPDWNIEWNEIRMGWYNINAVRISGNKIGIDGVEYEEGIKRTVADLVDFELTKNRNSYYWNTLFENLLSINKIPFENHLILDNPDKHFSSWSIKILENIFLTFNKETFEIQLIQNQELLFLIKNEFNGTEFYKLIEKINFRY